MNIITLFCEIDDFFLAYERWMSTQCLPETTPLETRGRPRRLHPSEGDDAPDRFSIKATIGRLSTFISNMSASIGAQSSRIW